MARWAGWGALPEVFDPERDEWQWARSELEGLVTEEERTAASRSTINAHYTSAEAVTAIWSVIQDLGLHPKRVLEPGCGSGNFLGLRHDGIDLSGVVGVELDPTTAAIAALLYPSADIRNESFAATRFPDATFDLAIGNVPFAKLTLHDPLHNRARHSLHNHFIVKALHLTRPGGLAALVTSRWTMDARNPAARREIASLADLLAAVRLPAGAFASAAGTDAICDILLLQRRLPGRQRSFDSEGWDKVVEVDVEGRAAAVNEYFARNRHLVLGDLRVGRGAYQSDELTVAATQGDLGRLIRRELGDLAMAHCDQSALATLETANPDHQAVRPRTRGELYKEGAIFATPEGGFAKIVGGQPQPFAPVPKSARAELAALVEIRDALSATLDAQASTHDDTAFAFAQQRLNRAYDHYRSRFGALNRFKQVRTGRVDAETGEETYRRVDPPMGGFRSDPDLYTVLALEDFDPETGDARKAPVFDRRVVAPRSAVLGADSAPSALAVSLDETGEVDLDRVAGLLGVDRETARSELGELVFDDPQGGRPIPAGRYLSGDVRTKLTVAEAAAAEPGGQSFRANVAALCQALPADLGPEEISVRLGATWIEPDDVASFVREVLEASDVIVEHSAAAAMWALAVPTWQRRSVTMTSEWGTARSDAIAILSASLEQRPVKIYDALDDGRRLLNSEETLAAREKQEALENRFSTWVWEDPERTDRLVERYNRLFNSLVPARYDGSHLTLPGLAETFHPHQHQRDAVWRIISEPSCLLGHAVGAGKTATMAMAGMELRRLGLISKPAYVVPNHMLAQFTNELLQLYPLARVLVADRSATTPAARKNFVARCATGEWDAVVITHASFERIPVSRAAEVDYIASKVVELRRAIAGSEARGGLTVKRLEAALARAEERQKRLVDTDKRDDGVSFEQTGIDYVFVDEAQAFKRLAFPSHIDGVSGAGSQRASDLDLKLHVLRQRHGDRVVTFATATPVTNSVAELYVIQHYLQPADLDRAGIDSFDAWAATFGRTVTALELAPDGGSYRLNTRFARFVNVPELLTLFSRVADVRTAGQLALPAPDLAEGDPQTVVVRASDALAEYVRSLVDRAEAVRNRSVDPSEDNMLKITGDGRKAALDLRLVGGMPDPGASKIAIAADHIARIWSETRDRRYPDAEGRIHHRPGSLQLVFCDLSTPGPRWNAYQELRNQLAARGVPEELVAFIHDADGDKAKADLFSACRDGRVAVLVGSTEKMGVGTNVQARAVALHHLDCPWRPTDIDQREGRLVRQGNHNPQVRVLRYVTEGSFDVFMWQTVERKAAFIHQVSSGHGTAREVDDVGDQALSFAQVKALATGNPLILERAGVEQELAKLQRLARAHAHEQHQLANRQRAATERADHLEHDASVIETALDRRIETRADLFAMTVGDQAHTSRVDAGIALRSTLLRLLDRHEPAATAGSSTTRHLVGRIGGFALHAEIIRQADMATFGRLRIEDLPLRPLPLERADVARADPAGLIARLEHRVRDLDRAAADLLGEADRARAEATAAAARVGIAFEHERRLLSLKARLGEIDDALLPDEEPTISARGDSASLPSVPEPVPAPPASTITSGPSREATRPENVPAAAIEPAAELSIHVRHHLYEQASQGLAQPPPTIQA